MRTRGRGAIAAVLPALFVVCGACSSRCGSRSGIGYERDPGAEANKTLLLRDFHPTPMIHTVVHRVPRSKFPAIDFHNHVNDGEVMTKHVDPAIFVKAMDAANVRLTVNLTGGWGERLDKLIAEQVRGFPGRFVVFAEIDYAHVDDAGYLVRELRESVAKGARGLKVLKDLGLDAKDPSGKLLAIDDPRLDPVWEEAGRLGIPVAMHIADPDAFFTPLDGKNERYEELVENPDWHFYDKGLPDKRTLLEARNHVFERHPKTTFVGLHVANHPEDLEEVGRWLDRYPNLYVETGARQAELGRQPRQARAFFLRYQDRIMFGSDARPNAEMYASWWRTFETADDYFDYYDAPEQGRWKIYGLDLPDDVLKKIYHDNAARLLRLDREPDQR